MAEVNCNYCHHKLHIYGLKRPNKKVNLIEALCHVVDSIDGSFSGIEQLRRVLEDTTHSLTKRNQLQTLLENAVFDKTALCVVDVQNDFVHGSLRVDKFNAQHKSLDLELINYLLQLDFAMTFASLDWHPAGHISFYENRTNFRISSNSKIQDASQAEMFDVLTFIDSTGQELEQCLWPSHCVANTEGAKIHSALKLPTSCVFIHKGQIIDVESYSAFGTGRETTGFEAMLKKNGIKQLVLCGLAFDFCVARTALDAARLGYRVVVIEDACVGIDEQKTLATREEMERANILITTSLKRQLTICILTKLQKQQTCVMTKFNRI